MSVRYDLKKLFNIENKTLAKGRLVNDINSNIYNDDGL